MINVGDEVSSTTEESSKSPSKGQDAGDVDADKKVSLTNISLTFCRTHKYCKPAAMGNKFICTPDVLNPHNDTCALRARHLCPSCFDTFVSHSHSQEVLTGLYKPVD